MALPTSSTVGARREGEGTLKFDDFAAHCPDCMGKLPGAYRPKGRILPITAAHVLPKGRRAPIRRRWASRRGTARTELHFCRSGQLFLAGPMSPLRLTFQPHQQASLGVTALEGHRVRLVSHSRETGARASMRRRRISYPSQKGQNVQNLPNSRATHTRGRGVSARGRAKSRPL